MLRGRDARAANGGRGMAWMGGYRGRTSSRRGMTGGEEWKRETGSREARWVMLRDEMPRGFIEQRRREEEGGRGSLLRWRENATEKERRYGLLCSNSKEHSRRTRTPFAPPTLRPFPFLSFSTFQPYETGVAARRKSSHRVVVSWGWKTLFLRSPFLRASSVPISLWPRRFSVPSFKRRQQSRRENDSIGFQHVFVQSILNSSRR